MTPLRNILEFTSCYHCKDFPSGYEERIERAHQQILALIPKKRECICDDGNLWKCDCGAESFNQAISETAQSMTGER